MNLELKGRVAVITGGSRGIGAAAAKAFVQAGGQVAICGRSQQSLDTAVAELNGIRSGSALGVTADIGTVGGVEGFASAAYEQFGRIDALVNSAGAAPAGNVEQLTDDDWALAIDLKLMGFIRCIRTVLPYMRKAGGGSIVNIAGNAGKQPDAWLVSSAVVNAAVLALTRAVAQQVATEGITVNAVCPGPTSTGRWAGLNSRYAHFHGVTEEEAQKAILSTIPTGRPALPEEVADAVLFLASQRARYITGTSVTIDGGQSRGI